MLRWTKLVKNSRVILFFLIVCAFSWLMELFDFLLHCLLSHFLWKKNLSRLQFLSYIHIKHTVLKQEVIRTKEAHFDPNFWGNKCYLIFVGTSSTSQKRDEYNVKIHYCIVLWSLEVSISLQFSRSLQFLSNT